MVLDLIRERKGTAAIAAILVAALASTYWVFWMPNPSPDSSGTVIYVPRGSSFRSALDSLEAAGGLRSRWAIRVAGKVLGLDARVLVGKYRFPSGSSNAYILEGLNSGAARELVQLVIPEGWRFSFIGLRSARVLGTDSTTFVTLCRDSSFLASLGIAAPTLEGYLLPDTYGLHWQTDERDVIRTLVDAFKGFYVDSLLERQKALDLSLNQVLTFASIVEGESNLDEERARVAGVYWNRLRRRMKLDADPTIQYIIPDGPRRLTYADLRIDSPYNTYKRSGLPPGPINNPGRASIIATLYPESHAYLFFVATGLGGHTFTRTYGEHLRAVRTFRATRRMMQQNGATQGR